MDVSSSGKIQRKPRKLSPLVSKYQLQLVERKQVIIKRYFEVKFGDVGNVFVF